MKTHLGHYEIESEIGRGGMGVVYRAFEPALSRHVAIKELSPMLADDPQLVERFLREARAMAALSDPHIIQIYYIGTDEVSGQPFFAMEYVDGESLSRVLKRDGKLPVESALKLLHQTAMGLATAHDGGVIHRDIKPGNLMLTQRGRVKIADFGIALATRDMAKKLTSTGEFVGTPGYLSPEVCTGKPIDQRSDIFSLGIVLYEMLSGQTPFRDESPLGLMLEVVKAEIPDIRELNDSVDASTAAILARMLAKEPEDRFQSCHDLVAALEAHPALAGGDTVVLARPAPADGATMVGTPAPASTPRPATPPPVVKRGGTASAAVASAASAAPVDTTPTVPTGRVSSTKPDVKRQQSRAGLALGIAALLVLAMAGGAFAFRGPVIDFVRGFGDGFLGGDQVSAYDAGRSTGQASNPIGTSQAAPGDLTVIESGDAHAGAMAGADPSVAPTGEGATGEGIAVAESGVDQTEDGLDASMLDGDVGLPASAGQVSAESLAMQVAGAQPSVPAGAVALTQASGAATSTSAATAPAAIAQTAAAMAPAAAAQAQAAQTVAVATPPKKAAPPPIPQRVVVVALGDEGISGPARQHIESRLLDAGFELADAEALGIVGDSLAAVLDGVRRAATVAVIVRAEPMGSRELQYYGRTSELYTANLTVRAYRTSDRSPIGTGLREKVDFTLLNAEAQAGAAVRGKLDRLVSDLSPYRGRG